MSFGHRRLEKDDDVFDNNAWYDEINTSIFPRDDYEWTEEMEKEAQAMVDAASEITMDEEQRGTLSIVLISIITFKRTAYM